MSIKVLFVMFIFLYLIILLSVIILKEININNNDYIKSLENIKEKEEVGYENF
ncbi:hypothetical protein [Deferribacter desulfuricans]|uniref:hypothetical protein n=1 Tax=Deferribacter desulfuricans TaxID=197162 RepID=UPI001375DDFC|nr:hypothetical protein [Deferribacter desulfuricans]